MTALVQTGRIDRFEQGRSDDDDAERKSNYAPHALFEAERVFLLLCALTPGQHVAQCGRPVNQPQVGDVAECQTHGHGRASHTPCRCNRADDDPDDHFPSLLRHLITLCMALTSSRATAFQSR